MRTPPHEFLARLLEQARRLGGADLLAARVDGDSVVVLFRQDDAGGSSGPVEGTRLQFERFAEQVLGPGAHRIDDVLVEAALEIVEPHEPGVRLRVDWADGLCDEPATVLWCPDAVDAARRLSSSAGPAGRSWTPGT